MRKYKVGIAAALLLASALFLIFTPAGNRVVAQTTGYRFAGNSIIFGGPGGGMLLEPAYNSGADIGLARLGAGQFGAVNGGINLNPDAVITPPPVIALAKADTGGTIPAGVIRGALIYVSPTGGLTNVAAAGEATVTTVTALSTITATAPIAAAGAAGYVVGLSPVAGATLTETLQPMSTAVCAGAFAVNGGAGLTVCPFGTNAVMTSLVTGAGIPLQNSASFPAAVPRLICNLVAQPANVTITTIQQMGSCILGAGIQNVSGKSLHVIGHLVYTTAGAPVITISALEGGITPIAVAGVATTGAATNGQVDFDYHITTAFTGSAGTLESHGLLAVQNNTALGTALGLYADQNVAVSSAINLTAANTLGLNITATVALSTATLRDLKVYLDN
jgi:hypothetical protein